MRKQEKMSWGEWALLLILASLIAISCTPLEIEEDIYPELQRAERGAAFLTLDGIQLGYNQTVSLDTLESFTYTQIYAESTDMAENQKYNGEANIRAYFSTDKHWHYSNGVLHDYPVYFVYPTSVRLIPPSTRVGYQHEYKPTTLPLWTKQMVGPIPKQSIIDRDTVKVYVDISFDGRYHVRDSILVALKPR
jgi:hypothetical protein